MWREPPHYPAPLHEPRALPHPNPLPLGEGTAKDGPLGSERLCLNPPRTLFPSLPAREGRGEGERPHPRPPAPIFQQPSAGRARVSSPRRPRDIRTHERRAADRRALPTALLHLPRPARHEREEGRGEGCPHIAYPMAEREDNGEHPAHSPTCERMKLSTAPSTKKPASRRSRWISSRTFGSQPACWAWISSPRTPATTNHGRKIVPPRSCPEVRKSRNLRRSLSQWERTGVRQKARWVPQSPDSRWQSVSCLQQP